MSLRSSHWWPGFVAALEKRPLRSLARELGVPEPELVEALIEADPKGPASDAPWWPEVLRLRSQLPLREIARRFHTEPRRLRRSLARAGLRAGGQELGGRGVPALAAFEARLGREPDATVAREAGVAIEAVQGERARLGIPPFRPGATLALTPEEEAWIRGPQREPRPRNRTDADSLQVVRRPARAGVDEGARARPPVRAGNLPAAPPALATRPASGPVPAPIPAPAPAPVPAPAPAAVRAGQEPVRETRDGPRVVRGFFRERERPDLDRLLTPSPSRDGRQRIVRTEPVRPPLPPPELPAAARSRPGPERSAWRAARVTAAELEEAAGPDERVGTAPSDPIPAPLVPAAMPASAGAPRAESVRAEVVRAEALRPAPRRASLTWHVCVPGDEAPIVVRASDLAGAAEVAARFLPRESWRSASIILAESARPPAS